MSETLNILITNDDGYTARGIRVLAETMRQFGRVTVIAPKYHQSGMSTAVTMGGKPIAYKELGNGWSYLDATPASCVKYAIDCMFWPQKPDVVVSGINQGANTATAVNYSGTLGAVEEAAINGIPGIGVSLNTNSPDADYSAVAELFPDIFRKIMSSKPEKGVYYNVNFPNLPKDEIKGIRVGHQGMGHWEREFADWGEDYFAKRGFTPAAAGVISAPKPEEGEKLFIMLGEFVDDSPAEDTLADHHIVNEGFVSISAHTIDSTDAAEVERLRAAGFDQDFQQIDSKK